MPLPGAALAAAPAQHTAAQKCLVSAFRFSCTSAADCVSFDRRHGGTAAKRPGAAQHLRNAHTVETEDALRPPLKKRIFSKKRMYIPRAG